MIAYTGRFRPKGVPFSGFGYRKGRGNLSFPVEDPGEGPGCPLPLIFRPKTFFGRPPPPPLSKGLDDRRPNPAALTREILFNTRREKRPNNVLFIILTPMKCQTISLKNFFAAKRAIYYVAIATVIFSHVKITCYFHV